MALTSVIFHLFLLPFFLLKKNSFQTLCGLMLGVMLNFLNKKKGKWLFHVQHSFDLGISRFLPFLSTNFHSKKRRNFFQGPLFEHQQWEAINILFTLLNLRIIRQELFFGCWSIHGRWVFFLFSFIHRERVSTFLRCNDACRSQQLELWRIFYVN